MLVKCWWFQQAFGMIEYVYKQRVYEVRMQGVIVAPVRMYTGGYYGLVVVPPRP